MQELRKSQAVTLGAVSASLCVCCLYTASQVPTMRLALIFLASVCTAPAAFEGKTALSYTVFLAAGALSFFLCPQRSVVILFAFFAHYVPFKLFIERRVFRLLWCLGTKCLYFCFFLFAGMGVLYAFRLLPEAFTSMPWVLLILPAAILLWYVLDRAYDTVLGIYQKQIRPHLFHQR